MTDFKLPDPKKTSGKVLGIGLLAAAGLLGYYYLLPFLLTIVWGTVELAAGIAVGATLLWILLSKKFWTRGRIILEAVGEMLFKGFVEMNPFTILTMSLDKAEKEREDLMEQNKLLQGQESKLYMQVRENQDIMRVSSEEVRILQDKLRKNPGDEDAQLQLETSTTNFNNAKDFVDTVSPIHSDIKKLVVFTEKAYRKSGNALNNAKNTVAMQRAKYDAVTAGRSALTKAWRAFTGSPEMNKAAGIALAKLQTDIANKVGAIRTTLKATSDIMNERDLKDAAKVSLAAQTVEQLNIDQTFDYTPSVEALTGGSVTPQTAGEIKKNKYLDYLNKK